MLRPFLALSLLSLAPVSASAAPAMGQQQARARLEAAHVEFTSERFLAAVKGGQLENVKLFLASGMDPDTVGADRFPALGLAVVEHHNDVVKAILDAGGKVVDESWAASPLFLAGLSANAEAEALLKRAGATLLPKEIAFQELVAQKSGIGKKQLFQAVEQGRADLVALQLKAGIDVNLDLFDGNTLLHVAAANGRTEIARMLLEAGAHVNARNEAGTPPIGFARVRNHEETAQLLLDAGAVE